MDAECWYTVKVLKGVIINLRLKYIKTSHEILGTVSNNTPVI